ncbi:hypothetical protein C8R46DRAFT_1027701 [Mycena filopes]|nr:hypothetical protein C8R46DRAFT_1027701 [Mycena filopes]
MDFAFSDRVGSTSGNYNGRWNNFTASRSKPPNLNRRALIVLLFLHLPGHYNLSSMSTAAARPSQLRPIQSGRSTLGVVSTNSSLHKRTKLEWAASKVWCSIVAGGVDAPDSYRKRMKWGEFESFGFVAGGGDMELQSRLRNNAHKTPMGPQEVVEEVFLDVFVVGRKKPDVPELEPTGDVQVGSGLKARAWVGSERAWA